MGEYKKENSGNHVIGKNNVIGNNNHIDNSKNIITNKLNLTEEQYTLLVTRLEERLGKELGGIGSVANKTIVQTLADRKILDYLGDIVCARLNDSQNADNNALKVELKQIVKETRDELKGLLEWNDKSLSKSVESLICKYEYRIDEKTASILINLGEIKEYLVGQNNFSKELAQGKECLSRADFEGAKTFFNKVTNHKDDHNQADIADAYFYSALAEWRVQLVLDNRYGCYQPICYDYTIDVEKGTGYSYYNYALNCSVQDKPRNEFYKGIVNVIKEILTEFNRLEDYNLKYDCFICFKETEKDGGKTDDYNWITNSDLVRKLEDKGISTFYSPKTLQELLRKSGAGIKYEAAIYHALSKAKCLLLVCSKEEYLKTPWVENEYTRFCAQLKSKNSKTIDTSRVIIVFNEKALTLPGELKEFRGEQHIDRSIQSVDSLVNIVKKRVENAKGYLDEERKYCLNCRNGKGYFHDNCPICGEKLVPYSVYTNEERRRAEEELKRAKEEYERLLAEKEEIKKREEMSKQSDKKIDFYDTDSDLQEIVPYGTEIITDRQFENREDLIEIIIPDTVTRIGTGAFKNCENLRKIIIPDSVTSIGADAFEGTDWYKWKPKGVVYAGKVAYKYNGDKSRIPSIIIKNGTRGIGDDVFSYCTSLTSITIPDSVTSIGLCAFKYCTGLTSITIPDSVTNIGDSAFYNCTSLTSVTIPGSVTNIGDHAFYNCSGLNAVYITDIAKWCGISFGSYSANPLSCAHNLYLNGELVKNLIIPNSVTNIGDYAFYSCYNLTSITIGNGVESIGEDALSWCGRLTNITIPDSVTSIGADTFNGTAWYKNQPDGLVYAGKVAYKYKGRMPHNASIVLKEGTVSIAPSAFDGCKRLKSIDVPNSVTSIGDRAFADCSSLTSVRMPNSVKSKGKDVFWGCKKYYKSLRRNLQSKKEGAKRHEQKNVSWEESEIKNWEAAARHTRQIRRKANAKRALIICLVLILTATIVGCGVTFFEAVDSSLLVYASVEGGDAYGVLYCISAKNKNIDIPSTHLGKPIVKICDDAFRRGWYLESITIPDSVTSIEGGAFFNTVWYKNQPDGLVYAGKVAYEYKGTMPANTSITIKDGTKGIAGYAFSYCRELTSITIPDSVKNIDNYAFSKCAGLTSITIGNGVTNMGDYAFDECNNLTAVYYTGTEESWNTIDIGTRDNACLIDATRYYYSETKPTEAGNYWHYDSDGVTPVVW